MTGYYVQAWMRQLGMTSKPRATTVVRSQTQILAPGTGPRVGALPA